MSLRSKDISWKQSEGSEPAACIVGAMRGNEYQQLYICSQLVKRLKELENSGAIVGDNQILVIPCVNNFSMKCRNEILGI